MATPATVALPFDALESYLDGEGIGSGPITATPIGDGASNLTYRLERGQTRVVLRRPPPPPLPPSAHDVVREARIQLGLAPVGVRVPKVLAVCEDDSILGVPFYLMEELEGTVVSDELPTALDTPEERRRLGEELLDGLIQLHAVDWEACGLSIGKPTGYLERQLRRWSGLWEVNATREVKACVELGRRLAETMPREPALDGGPRRLPPRQRDDLQSGRRRGWWGSSTGRWRRSATPWPTSATWRDVVRAGLRAPSAAADARSRRRPGFPTRAELIARYGEKTGRDTSRLDWYQAFALWKAAVFCEAIYKRYLRGERADDWSASLCDGVPRLLDVAAGYL